jgi:hypothetical protein
MEGGLRIRGDTTAVAAPMVQGGWLSRASRSSCTGDEFEQRVLVLDISSKRTGAVGATDGTE